MSNRTLGMCMFAILVLTSSAVAKSHKPDDKVPFKLYRDHLVITKGSLGSIENRNFLIDTGASPTVIDEALAHELGLRPVARPAGGMVVVGGVVQIYYAILESLELGPLHRKSIPVAVANLSLMQGEIGVRIDAMVGLDVLEPDSFQIDYDSQKIKFGSFRVRSPVPMVQSYPLVVITTRVNSSPVKLIVDTGSRGIVFFRNGLPEGLALSPTGRTVPLANVAGDLIANQVQLGAFQAGAHDLSGSMALLTTVPDCCAFNGIFGISASHVHRVVFDFQHQLLGLELPDTIAGSIPDACSPSLTGARCQSGFLAGSAPP